MPTITVIGAGYVGLVTAAGFAHLGHTVVCTDNDSHKIDLLNSLQLPIFEEGLLELVSRGHSNGRLRFIQGHDVESAASDFHFLCVATPQAEDGSADLSFLEAAAAELGPLIDDGSIVVNKSTVPVGSARLVEDVMQRPGVAVVSNPEFLREGSAVADFLGPDRIVIGATDERAGEQVRDLYRSIDTQFVLTDPASAELIKYASNSFLATKLSFINSVAAICEGVGAQVADVRLGMGLDSRIGLDFMDPGPGWGGSCFPKDTQAMVRIATDAGVDFAIVREAILANDDQLERVVTKILGAAGKSEVTQVGLLGLTFKAGTDDLRVSPALRVAEKLADRGVQVVGYDPVARCDAPYVRQVHDLYEACSDVDVVAIMTEWPAFADVDLGRVAAAMRGNTIVDTRRLLNGADVAAAGLRLIQIGEG